MKYVLVTGAYGGMGRATVSALVAQGYGVFALDRQVGGPSENVYPIAADVTDSASLAAAADVVAKVTDKLFAVVHFAGVYMMDSLVEMDESAFRRIVDINLTGAYLVNKTFAHILGNGSRIVITTSELAPLDPLPFTGIYAVTKAALDKYAYSLAMELQLLGIKVSVIAQARCKPICWARRQRRWTIFVPKQRCTRAMPHGSKTSSTAWKPSRYRRQRLPPR